MLIYPLLPLLSPRMSFLTIRDEKQHLIERQLKGRQTLQRQVQPMIQEYNLQVWQLKQDVAMYMAMGKSSAKILQEKLEKIQLKENTKIIQGRDHEPDM